MRSGDTRGTGVEDLMAFFFSIELHSILGGKLDVGGRNDLFLGGGSPLDLGSFFWSEDHTKFLPRGPNFLSALLNTTIIMT